MIAVTKWRKSRRGILRRGEGGVGLPTSPSKTDKPTTQTTCWRIGFCVGGAHKKPRQRGGGAKLVHSIVDGLADEAANPRLKHRAAQLVSMSEIRRINRARGHKKARQFATGLSQVMLAQQGLPALRVGRMWRQALPTQRRAASSVAQHAREGAKQKPRQGDGAKGAPCIGACRVATPGKPIETLSHSVAQRRGDSQRSIKSRRTLPRGNTTPETNRDPHRALIPLAKGSCFGPAHEKAPPGLAGLRRIIQKGACRNAS